MTPFAIFETAIGPCAIAWTERGIAALHLPEGSPSAARARMKRCFSDATESAPTRDVARSAEAIVALLDGEPRDLGDLVLDLEGVPPFHQRVYAVARTIPPGETMTYGEIAKRLGAPGAARAVGQALGKNPFAIVVPCHRVLARGGKAGGFSARGGVSTKLAMLAIEGVSGLAMPRA